MNWLSLNLEQSWITYKDFSTAIKILKLTSLKYIDPGLDPGQSAYKLYSSDIGNS